jgi:hypothetical protein
MKKFLTMMMVLALLVILPATALAQSGFYTWSISGSAADPFANTAAVPAPGLITLYLWFVEGCHPEASGGMAAAEFKITVNAGAGGWSFTAFIPQNSFFDAGPPNTAISKNALMAVGACPTGPVVAANMLFIANGSGANVGFTITDNTVGLSQVAATVDCSSGSPGLHTWPATMRCVGYSAGGVNQDHGQDCRVTSVESTTWGQIKGLYR